MIRRQLVVLVGLAVVSLFGAAAGCGSEHTPELFAGPDDGFDATAEGAPAAGNPGAGGGGGGGATDAQGSTDAASGGGGGGATDAQGSTDAASGGGGDGATDAQGSTDAAGDGSSGGGADAASSDGGNGGCGAYQLLCSGKCVSPKTDPQNCGSCGNSCLGATACSAGVCSTTCQAPLAICANECVDTKSDNRHCGVCNAPCAAGMGCVNGVCEGSIAVGPPPAKCAGGGPPILVSSTGKATDCAGNLAQVTFRWALCSCDYIGTLGGALYTDGYDSSKGPYTTPGLGAGVGSNGAYSTSEPTEIWGAHWTRSASGLSTSASYVVKQDVQIGGPWKLASGVASGDGRVAGNIQASGTANVSGTLYQSPGTTVAGLTYGARVETPVSVAEPCDCAASKLVPVGAIVAAHSGANNDNALIGLDPAVYATPRPDSRLELPCGHYYFTKITTGSAISIAVKGNTAVYIGGDVTVGGTLSFVVDPAATLDIFVAGAIFNSAQFNVGSPNYPSQARLYVGGTSTFGRPDAPPGGYSVFLDNPVNINGNVYAPYGQVFSGAKILQYGSIFAGSFINSADTTIHFDKDVLAAGKSCAPGGGGGGGGGGGADAGADAGGDAGGNAGRDAAAPDAAPDAGATACGSCRDCGNQACINGKCDACTSSAQCCAPLVCIGGTCKVSP